MVVLNIAHINDNACNGVCVVVPRHVKAQQRSVDSALLSVTSYVPKDLDNAFKLSDYPSVENLPPPFNAPDIVVFHEVYRPVYLKMYRCLLKKKIPYVIVPHGELTFGAQRKKRLKKTVANILLFNRFINAAAAVQYLSPNESDSSRFGRRRFIGTNGIDLPADFKARFSIGGFKLLYIGRLDMYHKGLDLMLDAVKLDREFLRKNNCKLYIYGPDREGRFAALKNRIESGGISDLVIAGHEILGERKREELLSADCFIQTSRFEGMPMGILEAMSYGLPCIVTEGTTLSSFVKENGAGWTCENSAESIAYAVRNAVETLRRETA